MISNVCLALVLVVKQASHVIVSCAQFRLGMKQLRWCNSVVVYGDFGDTFTELPGLSCLRHKLICRDCHGVRETLLPRTGKMTILGQ